MKIKDVTVFNENHPQFYEYCVARYESGRTVKYYKFYPRTIEQFIKTHKRHTIQGVDDLAYYR